MIGYAIVWTGVDGKQHVEPLCLIQDKDSAEGYARVKEADASSLKYRVVEIHEATGEAVEG